jgi:hypothetical protein
LLFEEIFVPEWSYMSQSPGTPTPVSRRRLQFFLRCSAITLLFLLFRPQISAQSAKHHGKLAAARCTLENLDFDPVTDVHALEEYQHKIAALLQQERFSELDCLADSARASKARFSGGKWKLARIYAGIDEPQPGHPTEEDWKKHLQRVNHWVKANRHSITARIALAESYISYGWNARGNDSSDTVSDSGRKLFSQRLDRARSILVGASALPTKCPEWYAAMQQIAMGQSWDEEKANELFEQAIKFEPGYDFYYRSRARYLLPKWHGTDGDTSRFAQQVADRVGGKAGDILYFQIGTEIVCACTEPEFNRMSWPRLQQGFEALRAEYGESLLNWNKVGLMAVKFADPVAADIAFKRFGDEWDKDIWRTEEWFKYEREWAEQSAPSEAHYRAVKQEANANLSTSEGAAYKRQFDPTFSALEQSCAQKVGNATAAGTLEFLVKVAQDGGLQDALVTNPNDVSFCVFKELRERHAAKEKIFPAPPHDGYWIIFESDPTVIDASAGK